MRWGDHHHFGTFVPRQLVRRRADPRDWSGRAGWIGIGGSGGSKFENARVADALLEGSGSAPPSSVGAARTIAWPRREALRDPNCKAKRCLDLALAFIAIVALLPILLVVAITVMIDSRGPVLFRQWRGGHNGRRFQILKFRTMTCLEDGNDVRQAQPGDARVTRVGRVLRKTSLDELPQLFNVLCGDMSLVGPRPHALVHDEYYSGLIRGYADRQLVKPGITGWAQINDCRGETRDISAMERRIRRDLEYIRHWSLRLDFIILIKTVKEVLRPKNAY